MFSVSVLDICNVLRQLWCHSSRKQLYFKVKDLSYVKKEGKANNALSYEAVKMTLFVVINNVKVKLV